MTIKKLNTVKAAPQARAAGAGEAADTSASTGKPGATIADRFKLDAPDPASLKAAQSSKKAAQWALTAALLALAAAGILTYLLYQHWEFLMPV